jgi:hypothetical protein
MRVKIVTMPETTNNLTKAIINKIIHEGHFAWRVNTAGIFDEKKNRFRTVKSTGCSDVCACIFGRLVCIEVKLGKDKLRESQRDFGKNIDKAGGIYIVVHSYQDFIIWFGATETLIRK